MTEPRDRRLRGSRIGIMAAAALALGAFAVYYFGSTGTQPSVVSGDGADLMSPQDAESAAQD